MASGKAIKAGEAYVRLFGDDSALNATLKSAEKRLRAFGTAVATVGAGLAAIGGSVLGGLLAATRSFATYGAEIDDLAKRSGMSVEALSELGFAAEQEGASLEDLATGVRKFSDLLGQAMSGSDQARASLRALGLEWEQLARLSPDDRILAVADALARIEDPAQRTAAALDVFGKSGETLIPLFKNGAAGIEELRRQARELGISLGTHDAEAAAALDDSLAALGATIAQLWRQIGSALAPALNDLVQQALPIIAGVVRWIDENRELVMTLALVAAGVTAVGVALVGVGGAFVVAGAALGGLSAAIGLVGTVLGGTAVFLNSWGGLLLVVAAACVTVTGLLGNLGDQMAWLGDRFQELRATALTAIEGIADALAYGDIELAAEILWAGLYTTWLRGASALNTVFEEVRYFAVSTMNVISAAIRLGFEQAMHFVVNSAINSLRVAGGALAGFASGINPALGAVITAGVASIGSSATGVTAVEDARHQQAVLDITQELLQAQASLAQAKAEDLAASQSQVDAAQAKLDALRAEAMLRRRIHEQGQAQLQQDRRIQAVGRNAVVAASSQLGNFDLKALAGQVGSPDRADQETARNTKDLMRIGENILRRIERSGTLAFV